jgi:hemolysin III
MQETARPARVERFNSASHLVGAGLSAVGLAALLVRAWASEPSRLLSLGVYGASLVLLYLASGIYHGLRGPWRARFRRLDHLAIYLLIAGTYTPIAVLALRSRLGHLLLLAIWMLAVLGAIVEFVTTRRMPSVLLYVGMGWLAASAAGELVAALSRGGMAWLLGGGILYTVGALFYLLDRRWPAAHGVFHVFVLGGSASHFVAIWLYVA